MPRRYGLSVGRTVHFSMHNQHPSLDSIRAALAVIPADDRDLWVKMAFAIKSAYPGDDGFAAFDEWSQRASNYDAAAVRATWRNGKAGGKVTHASIFFEAKRYGFDPRQYAAPASSATAEQIEQVARERRAREDAEQASKQQEQAAAARQAGEQWEAATEATEHAYLTRKGVRPHGVRCDAKGSLLVPLCDVAGVLWNVQRIPARSARNGPDKVFCKGGRVTGCMHWIGDPESTDAVLLAEGYATGASLHEATGRPVAVAFNVGNLEAVALAIRGRWPGVRLLVCGDDDMGTEAKTGKNPGKIAAKRAAEATGGGWCVPDGLTGTGTDFNDLAASAGTDAVREQIERAIASLANTPGQPVHASAPSAVSRQRAPMVASSQAAGGSGNSRRRGGGGNAPARERPYYEVLPGQGVYFYGIDSKGADLAGQWVCAPLHVRAHTRTGEGQDWGYLLAFDDRDGTAKQWAMPAELLHGDGAELAKLLSNQGLDVKPDQMARKRLLSYIQQAGTPGLDRVICTDRVGWHHGAFVLPKQSYGDGGQRVVFQSQMAMPNTFQQRGTAAEWRDKVGALCAGNTRLVFAASCAFAGPLLRHAAMDSGGFHLRGNSSLGKSTAQLVAASVYGSEEFKQQWRSTDNALEATAAQYSDTLLILDELKQIDPRAAGECAYMLANGRGKARMSRTAAPRPNLQWSLLFLSSGELSLADHMQTAGQRIHAGQEVRLPDIPADAGAGLGLFNTLHESADARTFAERIKGETRMAYGAAGVAFIQWLVARIGELPSLVKPWVGSLVKDWMPAGASGQVERVASRFALVAVGGELATEAGITGWQSGEAERGARACFDAWLEQRGNVGDSEEVQMLRQVRQFLESHGESRFPWWHRSNDDHKPNAMYRAGLRVWVSGDGERLRTREDHYAKYGDQPAVAQAEASSCEYVVFQETFRNELCKGFDPKAVLRVLHERGCLRAEGDGKSFKYARRERVPGVGLTRVYCLLPAIFETEV